MNNEENSLELIRGAIAAGGFGRGIGRSLRMRGTDADLGRVALSSSPDEDFHNPLGSEAVPIETRWGMVTSMVLM